MPNRCPVCQSDAVEVTANLARIAKLARAATSGFEELAKSLARSAAKIRREAESE